MAYATKVYTAYEAIQVAVDTAMTVAQVLNGDWHAVAKSFLDIDLNFQDQLEAKVRDIGLDDLVTFMGKLDKHHIGIHLGNDDQAGRRKNRRRFKIPTSRLKVALRWLSSSLATVSTKNNWIQEKIGTDKRCQGTDKR